MTTTAAPKGPPGPTSRQPTQTPPLTRPVVTPTVLQMEMSECGAASLSIILQYYGRYVPLTELRQACGVSRDGSDAASLLKAAALYGLSGKGFKKGLKRLQEMALPVVLFWEFNHFLVLEGFQGSRVLLNDPALGRRSVSAEEFETSYTGVTLELRPGAQFQRGGQRPRVGPAILARLRAEPEGVLFCFLSGIGLILPKLLLPVFSQVYIDDVVGSHFEQWLKPLLWAMVLCLAALGLGRHLQLLGRRELVRRLDLRFSLAYQHQVLSLPDRFFSQRFAAEVSYRGELNKTVAQFITDKLLPLASDQLLLIVYLVLVLLYSPILGGLLISTTGIHALLIASQLRLQKDSSQQLQKDGNKAQATVISALKEIETVKASGVEPDIFKTFAGYQARSLSLFQSYALRSAQMELLPAALNGLNQVGVLGIGFVLVLQGKISLGMLLAVQVVAMELVRLANQLLEVVRQLPEFEASVLLLEDVMEQPADPLLSGTPPANPVQGRLSGAISLRKVSFAHVPIKPALIQDLDLEVRPGQRIALVGSSGSGKSTVARVISGLLQPTGGELLFDGEPLSTIPREVSVNSIAMVQQDGHLFGCSVIDNLTYWDRSIPRERVNQACKDAQIDTVVKRLPAGYDTVLSEGGSNLSGGQRQRLEIARALLRDPSILILDEATAALDPETERLVSEALRRRGCTQIIVAHRLSTIRDADWILVLDKGQVVQGRHGEMVAIPTSPYAQLVALDGHSPEAAGKEA